MYKITIEKIVTEKVTKKGEWGIIEKRPYTDKEIEEAHHTFTGEGEIRDVMGYKPEYQTIREKVTQVLEQTVEEFDLIEVIKAVNNIKGV